MKCPKCYRENTSNSKYCAYCGASIQVSNATQLSNAPVSNKTQIVQNKYSGRNVSELMIGRASNCDISINDNGVSSKHAKILVDQEKIYIEDLRSLNGTFVNGHMINSRHQIRMNDSVYLGTYRLDLRNSKLYPLFSMYGQDFSQSGTIKLKVNSTWFGKIFYFLLLLLFFFPWITISVNTTLSKSAVSISALDFALNKVPLNISDIEGANYGPIHSMFLVILILLIIGLTMNFFKLKISDKFNYVNILSIIIFILTVSFVYVLSYIDNYMGPFSIQHNFASFLFILLSFFSIFEGLLEYYVAERKNFMENNN